MFRSLILYLLSIISFNSYSQCTPNPIYQDSTGNIWPLSGFPDGIIGVHYYEYWDMKAPATLIEAANGDTTAVTVDTLGSIIYIGDWPVDSVVTIDVYDLPPGITVDCSVPGCTYLGGEIGCANIYGIPTATGIYDVEIVTNLYTHGIVSINVGGVPLTLPVELDYFSVTGTYDTVSRYSINILESTSILSTPKNMEITNIFHRNNHLYLNIYSENNNNHNLKIMDMLGKEIYNQELLIHYGENEYEINLFLEKGIYILNLHDKYRKFSKKFNVYK